MVTESQFLVDLQGMLDRNSSISMDMDLLDIEEWDSFSKAVFIAAAEQQYHIKVERFAVAMAETVADLYNALQNAVEKQGE